MTLRNAFADLATEATLEEINVKTPALSNGNVPVEDEAIYSMIDTLNELVSRLGILLSARALDGTLRVSGTVSVGTVTTNTTVTNQAAMGGYQTTAAIQNQMNTIAQLANTANVG